MIARAIDVGHGNTKFTTSSDSSAKFDCTFFPSIAPQSASEFDIGGGVFSKQETVNITIGDASYTVGRDVKGHGVKRILDESFPLSSVYMALVRGALYYMGCEKIAMLTLGLPLNTYRIHRETLEESMKGRHVLPGRPSNKDRSEEKNFVVDVGIVGVLPQPMGTFYNYCFSHGRYEAMSKERNLIIDVGHGTLDWFVSDSMQPDYSRSGADFTGMSAVAKAVATKISEKAASNFNILADIDRSIRTGEVMKYAGKAFNARDDFKSVIETTVKNSVAGMLQSIGDPDDLHNIIVTGGGADIYWPEIRKSFSHENLIMANDGMYANVLGFQMVGLSALSSLSKRAA